MSQPPIMVYVDVTEELNRLVSISLLAPTTHLDAIEGFMNELRAADDVTERNLRGAQVVLDLIQSVRELKSAGAAYAEYINSLEN